MIVCLCKSVNDRRLDQVVAGGARTPGQVARACGAGTDCGRCVAEIRRRLARARQGAEGLPLAAK